jgi:hypothetical protein
VAMTDKSIRGLCDQGGGRGPGTGRGAPLQAVTSPGAAALITERGGRLYVWVTKFHCCGGAVRIVCSSPGAPRGLTEFRRFEAAEFQVLLHPSIGRAPARMDIRLLGRWRPRITLYWDGMPI